jgi:hypothetical protein
LGLARPGTVASMPVWLTVFDEGIAQAPVFEIVSDQFPYRFMVDSLSQ